MRLLIFVSLCCGLPLQAQSWDALRSLNPGDRVKVLETGGQEHSGVFARFSPNAISLTAGHNEVSVERSRVRRVQLRSGARRARRVLIGAAIGVAVGLTVDQTLGAYLRNESGEGTGSRAITYIAPIALFGGIAGAFPAYRTIYRAP
jgi:hypothetical protein